MADSTPIRSAGDAPATPIAEQSERYDAFISYSHAADGSLAPALQHGLQTLAKPLYQRKALRVFRDQTNLAATPELWSMIEQALAGSRFFILLASPAAASSPWVQQELRWWHRHRGPERLLIGLTHGAIAWDPAAADFDWHATDALPQSLSRWLQAEPLWVDLRWTSSKSALSHRDPRLQEDLATLAAPLRGMSKDDLIGRDLKQHRKAVRLTVAAIALLVVLAVAAGAGAWVAVQQRGTAQQQTALAESRALASAAGTTAAAQLDLALLLAERAVQMNPTPESLTSLFSAVSASPQLVRFMPQRSPVTTLAGGPGGGMVVGDTRGDVSLLDTSDARQLPLPEEGGGSITALADSGPGGIVASGSAHGTVSLWSLSAASGSLRWRRALGSTVQGVAISPDATAVAAVLQDNRLVGLDASNGRILYSVSLGSNGAAYDLDHVTFLQNDLVLAGSDAGSTERWRTEPQPRQVSASGQETPGDESVPAAWSGDGRTFLYAANGTPALAPFASGPPSSGFGQLPATTTALAIDDSANLLAYISNGMLAVENRSRSTSTPLPGFTAAEQIAFTADGRYLVAAGGDTLVLFDLSQQSRLATELPAQLAPLTCEACSTSVATNPRGDLVVWTDGPDIVCYDTRSSRQRRYPGANPYSSGGVVFTPDGSELLSYGGSDVGVWSASAGCPSSVRWVPAGDNASGQLVPAGSDRAVISSYYSSPLALLDLRRGKIVRTYRLPNGADVSSTAVSSDDRTLAVSLTTGKIEWFDLDSGTLIATNGSSALAGGNITFLPGSEDVAQTTLTSILIWNPQHGQVGVFDGSGSAQKLSFSHDGRLLFALDNQDELHIWDTASRTLIGSVQALPLTNNSGTAVAGGAEYGERTGMALDDNDNIWVAASSAYPTRWTLSPSAWSGFACAWAGRTLTPAEWREYVGTNPPADLSCPR